VFIEEDALEEIKEDKELFTAFTSSQIFHLIFLTSFGCRGCR